VIRGNRIGTTADGMAARGNDVFGVHIKSARNTTIAGRARPNRNVISGNNRIGVDVGYNGSIIESVAIQGNFIGTNASGTAALPNGECGIELSGRGVTIGGTAPGAGKPDLWEHRARHPVRDRLLCDAPADDNVAMGTSSGWT